MIENQNPEGLKIRDRVTHDEYGPGVVYLDRDGTLGVACAHPDDDRLCAVPLDGCPQNGA